MFGMILMGLLVFSFAIWGVADVFRGYGEKSLIRVGDIEINLQDYSRAEREALRAMSADAGRNLSKQEAMKMGLENRDLGTVDWRRGGRQSRARSRSRHVAGGRARADQEGPGVSGPDRKFQSACPRINLAIAQYDRARLHLRDARARFAPSADRHGRRYRTRTASPARRAGALQRRASQLTLRAGATQCGRRREGADRRRAQSILRQPSRKVHATGIPEDRRDGGDAGDRQRSSHDHRGRSQGRV